MISYILSKRIVIVLKHIGIVDEEYKEAYVYCFDLLFDIIVYNLSLLIIGGVIGCLELSILYVLVMTPLKMIAGGAHADSRLKCDIISYGVYFVIITLSRHICANEYVIIVLTVMIMFAVVWMTPMSTCDIHGDSERKKQMKCGIYCAIIVLFDIMILVKKSSSFSVLIMLVAITILINQIVGIIGNRRCSDGDEDCYMR